MSKRESVWKSTATISERDKLMSDIECDVLVIGAGISGVLTAYFLSQNGIDTVVVDASRVCNGQTACTTAKITSQHSACYQRIAKSYSLDTALTYASANERAIDTFDKLVCDLRISCDFERLPSYLYSENSESELLCEYSIVQRSAISAVLTKRTELPFDVKLALRYQNQAQFNPYPFIDALSGYISIFENTRVLRVDGNIAYCDAAKIKAKKIVFATHYPFVNFPGLFFARMHQSRSYVLALRNIPKLNAMYYSVDKCGLSFRRYRDMTLVSGGSHRCGEYAVNPNVYSVMFEKVSRLYPQAQLCYKFSAQDCMSPDHLPYAGVYSAFRPDWYVISGFSKWGMTNSLLSAKLVSDMILGNKNKLERILSPQRFSSSLVLPMLNETAHAVKGLSRSFFKIPLSCVGDIERDSGKVVSYKGKKCAVYVSQDGQVYAIDARCPHMKCELSFNQTEKTWDCPCHGSRFSYTGELLDSPSQKSLKRYL